MSQWRNQVLSAAMAICLILCHTVYAFAGMPEETASTISAGYSESDVRKSENFEQLSESKPESEPENHDVPQAQIEPQEEPGASLAGASADLPKPQEDEASEPPDETEQPDMVSDEAELTAWIAAHKATGGTVSLGASVTITEAMGIYGIYGEITIDTGEYGLVFDGGTLPSSAILIIGEGVDVPVVGVLSANGGNFWDMSWNQELMKLNVTATGRDGAGGVALCILAGDTKPIAMDALDIQGIIRSYGEGAIGLWLDVPMEAYCYRVEVFGDHSVAVYAPNGADLYYCKLTAEGNGASAVVGNDVMLDVCAATPEPEGVKNLTRCLLPESLCGLYLPIRQNDSLTWFDIYPFTSIILPMSGGDGYEAVRRLIPIDWDTHAYDSINTGVLGKSDISGYLPLPLQGLGLDSTTPSLTVEVRDPDLPCIQSISAKSGESENFFNLSFWDSYDPADGNITLWRSDDEGETWWDATWSENVIWEGYSLRFFYDTLEQPVWLVLELLSVGDSNTVALSEKDGWAVGGTGGDRTGTDREGAGSFGSGTSVSGGDTSTGGDGNISAGSDEQSRGNHNEIPGESEGASGGKLDSDAVGKEADDVNGRYPQNNTDAITLKPAPEETPLLNKAGESVMALGTVSGTAAGTGENPVAAAADSKSGDTEKIQLSPTGALLPITEEPLAFDPEQSAPELGFSVNALAVFFVGVAALCFGALLALRSGWFERWRNEKG